MLLTISCVTSCFKEIWGFNWFHGSLNLQKFGSKFKSVIRKDNIATQESQMDNTIDGQKALSIHKSKASSSFYHYLNIAIHPSFLHGKGFAIKLFRWDVTKMSWVWARVMTTSLYSHFNVTVKAAAWTFVRIIPLLMLNKSAIFP